MAAYNYIFILTVMFAWYICLVTCYIEHPGPRYLQTKGEIWPKPKHQVKSEYFRVVLPSELNFMVTGYTCDIIENATKRLLDDIDGVTRRRVAKVHTFTTINQRHQGKKQIISDPNYIGRMVTVYVNLTNSCETMPYLEMDESYQLEVMPEEISGIAKLSSSSVWGILRGLESLYHSLYFRDDNTENLHINVTYIEDSPRLPHRGVLLDTSRHYISKFTIFKFLDGLSYNKFNVFHWHIVDDQSFPYVSTKFPTMSEKGAYNLGMVYTPKDIADIIEYARLRGIRVIPEFDTPGHTRSWGVAFPNLLAQCYNSDGNIITGALGPINPSLNETYTFMGEFLAEVSTVFKDKYIHLGGDEVTFECWQNNPIITGFMEKNNISSYRDLESFYIQNIVSIVNNLEVDSVVWQEVFENNVAIPSTTVVQLWYGNIPSNLKASTSAGYKTLLSTCWYLDHLSTGGDWVKYYECDPLNFNGTEAEKKLVMGGEACMWAEVIDNTNVLTRVFPRASATAEKLWSPEGGSKKATHGVHRRLEEHSCRMNLRGVPSQPPSGPGYCF